MVENTDITPNMYIETGIDTIFIRTCVTRIFCTILFIVNSPHRGIQNSIKVTKSLKFRS